MIELQRAGWYLDKLRQVRDLVEGLRYDPVSPEVELDNVEVLVNELDEELTKFFEVLRGVLLRAREGEVDVGELDYLLYILRL